MPNPDLASERRSFETWWESTGHQDLVMHPQRALADGIFQGWLARSAVSIVVSEEMVEAACRAWQDHLLSPGAWDDEHPDRQSVARETMRLCLTAALTTHESKP